MKVWGMGREVHEHFKIVQNILCMCMFLEKGYIHFVSDRDLLPPSNHQEYFSGSDGRISGLATYLCIWHIYTECLRC